MNHIANQTVDIVCVDEACNKIFDGGDITAQLTDTEKQTYYDLTLKHVVKNEDNFITCPNEECNNIIERVENLGMGQRELDLGINLV